MIPIYKLMGRLGNNMFQFAFIHSQVREGNLPDIYLQDEKFFEKYANEIRMMYGQDIGPEMDMVSIHVRRGDYVGNPFYVDLSKIDYYEKAMAMFPDDQFLIFSDDIQWCKEQKMFSHNCEFLHGSEIDDMNAMASCKHNIIANSSFSWWAAWLNPNPNKKVVYPKFWYTDGIERTVCPKTWIPV